MFIEKFIENPRHVEIQIFGDRLGNLIYLGERASLVKNLVDQLTRVVFSIVEMIITLSPVGAFGAMAFTVGRFGLHSLLPLLKLILVFYGACLAFVLIILVPIARHVGHEQRQDARRMARRPETPALDAR